MKTKQQNLEKLFSTLHERGAVNGAVLAAEQGEILYQAVFGYGELSSKRELILDSVFELASLSKPFTATAIMLLEEKGQLSYDDLIERWLPDFPYPGITVRHLLNHTSGLPDFMDLFREHWDHAKIGANEDVLNMLMQYKPERYFAPDESWAYSNTGYVLLAVLVQRITGLSFAEYMKTHIFHPLGMLNTRVYNRRYSNDKIADYAYGYVYDAGLGQFVLPDQLSETQYVIYLDGIQGDGTVNSTVGDLFKFDQALYSERILSRQSLERAFAPVRLDNGETFDYGFGWLLEENADKGKIVSHSGGWPGYATNMLRYVDCKKTIIYLSNMEQDHEFEQQIVSAVENILFDQPFEIPERPAEKNAVQVDSKIYGQYTGSYKLSDGISAWITAEQDSLYLQIQGQIRLQLYPSSEVRFFIRSLPVEVEFVIEAPGQQASKFIIFQAGMEDQAAIRAD